MSYYKSHPMYKFMVGDTVKNVGPDYSKKQLVVHVKKPFIIKEAMQVFVSGGGGAYSCWEPHYKGLIKNLSNYGHDEDEICTCRMVLLEKLIRFVR